MKCAKFIKLLYIFVVRKGVTGSPGYPVGSPGDPTVHCQSETLFIA